MKYVANVKQVLHADIRKIGAIENDELKVVAAFPLPDRVEIELEGTETEPCMMYRYTNHGDFCGDTWHETFAHALEQAEFEYGLKRIDFEPVADGEAT